MPDKISDNEIVKALEDMIQIADMVNRSVLDMVDVQTLKNTLDLINRLQAENERLKNHIKEGINLAKQLPEMVSLAKAEAYKECIEKVKSEIKSWTYNLECYSDKKSALERLEKYFKELKGK